ncbi:MAG: hypothetical protein ACJ8KA_14505, partial [Sulfurifustis sp.]
MPPVRGSSDDPYLLPGRPTIPLIVEISHPQEARIVIDELPEAVLKQTTVYIRAKYELSGRVLRSFKERRAARSESRSSNFGATGIEI